MKTLNKKKSGLVLIETMLAIAMLAIGAVIAGNYLNSAIESQVYSRDFLIANNLADEGVELVKTLRNTNWLQHPSDPHLWLDTEPLKTTSTSLPKLYDVAHYLPVINNGIKIIDVDASTIPDLNLTSNTTAESNVYRLISCPDDGLLYTYTGECSGGTTENTKFYRVINFTDINDTSATFTVKVQWDSINGVKTIERTTTIYNK